MSNLIAGIAQDYSTRIEAPISKENTSFDDNPQEAVECWRQMLAEDIRAGKRINEYRVLVLFQNLPQEQKYKIAEYIRSNFSLKLNFPPGKICLAEEKDALEDKLENYSAKHLLVLLYSITVGKETKLISDRKHPAISMIYDNSSGQSIVFSLGQSKAFSSSEQIVTGSNTVTIGSGERKIAFEGEIKETNPKKIMQIHDLVAELNEIIPSNKIHKVKIVQDIGGLYSLDDPNMVSVSTDFINTTAHEMGHAIFHVLLEKKDPLWQRIYYLSLEFKSYEIVDDSNYADLSDIYGHPFDSANELFASSLAAYTLNSEKFLKYILDPDTGEETRKIGKSIFIYLRDKIFNGKVYSRDDPFKMEHLDLDEISDEEISNSLCNALASSDRIVRFSAADAVGELGLKDERFIDLLIKDLGHRDFFVRDAAIKAIGKLKDKRFIDPLIKALVDDDTQVRFSAARAIGELGIKDEKLIDPLIKTLGDSDWYVQDKAKEALDKLGIKLK
ncbi:MAG: HEAT repeat domain-containing protein [Candidatus Saganbacteria bacterium]|nr:HEAT repeat domain-containing protein [Candidatus Saganbacteria bacterium]